MATDSGMLPTVKRIGRPVHHPTEEEPSQVVRTFWKESRELLRFGGFHSQRTVHQRLFCRPSHIYLLERGPKESRARLQFNFKRAEQIKPTQSKPDTMQGRHRSQQCYRCQAYGHRNVRPRIKRVRHLFARVNR